MVNYQQLELFDLDLYTVKIPIAMEVATMETKEKQTKNAVLNLEGKQLEIDLFPQSSNLTVVDFLKLAA
jgi:hypothetical protein